MALKNLQTDDRIHRKHAQLLGVYLDSTPMSGLLRKITVDIKNNHKFYITTPNPEIVMSALKDNVMLASLNASEIAIADGIGLSAAYTFMELKSPKNIFLRFPVLVIQGLMVGAAVVFNRSWLERKLIVIKGRELFLQLILLANKNSWKVYFLGGEGSEADDSKNALEKSYKRVKIMTNRGPMLSIDGTPLTSTDELIEKRVINDINNFAPEMLFVGISHPRQEKWLYRWYNKLNIGGAMAVGGTFRFVSGKYILPPKIFSSLGLEWLWRLLTGSQRFSRIWTATVKFPLQVFRDKLLN